MAGLRLPIESHVLQAMDHSRAIYLDHVELHLHPGAEKFAILPEAGIVDQDIHLQAGSLGRIEDLLRRLGKSKVGDNHLGLDGILAAQPLCQQIEPLAAAGSEHQVDAGLCQLHRDGFTDAGAGASNDCPLALPGLTQNG